MKFEGLKRLPGAKVALTKSPFFGDVETGETINRFRAVSEPGCPFLRHSAQRNQELYNESL